MGGGLGVVGGWVVVVGVRVLVVWHSHWRVRGRGLAVGEPLEIGRAACRERVFITV